MNTYRRRLHNISRQKHSISAQYHFNIGNTNMVHCRTNTSNIQKGYENKRYKVPTDQCKISFFKLTALSFWGEGWRSTLWLLVIALQMRTLEKISA